MSKKCDQCGKSHRRVRFCCNKCKDRWHNARKRMQEENAIDYFAEDYWDDVIHPFSGEGLGQDIEL